MCFLHGLPWVWVTKALLDGRRNICNGIEADGFPFQKFPPVILKVFPKNYGLKAMSEKSNHSLI
jgi:hypothetical protein